MALSLYYVCVIQSVLDAPCYGFPGQDAVPNEDSSPDVSGVSDIDLDELLKGLNIGSPRKERKTATVEANESDEVRHALNRCYRRRIGADLDPQSTALLSSRMNRTTIEVPGKDEYF